MLSMHAMWTGPVEAGVVADLGEDPVDVDRGIRSAVRRALAGGRLRQDEAGRAPFGRRLEAELVRDLLLDARGSRRPMP